MLWQARPISRFALVRRALPTMVVGVLVIIMALTWISLILYRDLKPPAGLTEPLIGLFVLVIGVSTIATPFQIWWTARKTRYFLTDRCAIVCEPTLFGHYRASSYRAEALALMHREGFGNGMGDLVFGVEKSGFGGVSPCGFLGIENVRDVEALVHEALLDARPLRGHSVKGPCDDPEFRPIVGAGKLDDRMIHRLPDHHRALPLITLGLCAIGTPILIVGIILMLVGPGLLSWIGMANSTLQGLIVLFIFGVGVSGLLTLYFIRVPYEIALKKDATIEFRSWMRTIEFRPEDIISVRTGGWNDPNRVQLHVRHKSGKMVLPNQFSDFRDFLVALKSLNPSVEITGF